ncbi:MAG: response regulator [Thermoanaerobaculia bacterium]
MKKILIVEDDAILRDFVVKILKDKYEIREASSSEEASEILKSYKPDLILLDVMMEDTTSGFNFARNIKEEENFKDVKIIITTSIDKELNIDFKKEAGNETWLPVDDYIVKPIDPQKLLEKINNLLSPSRK